MPIYAYTIVTLLVFVNVVSGAAVSCIIFMVTTCIVSVEVINGAGKLFALKIISFVVLRLLKIQ